MIYFFDVISLAQFRHFYGDEFNHEADIEQSLGIF